MAKNADVVEPHVVTFDAAKLGQRQHAPAASASRPGRRVLVPVLDGDISEAVFAYVRALLVDSATRVALLHVVRARPCASPGPRRWRRLAAEAAIGRVFVDVVAGDPFEIMLAQSERFGCDTTVLGKPVPGATSAAWIEGMIARLQRAAPRRVIVVGPDMGTAPVGAVVTHPAMPRGLWRRSHDDPLPTEPVSSSARRARAGIA